MDKLSFAITICLKMISYFLAIAELTTLPGNWWLSLCKLMLAKALAHALQAQIQI